MFTSKLNELDTKLSGLIFALSAPQSSAPSIIQNIYHEVFQSSRVSHLDGTDITDAIIVESSVTGGSISGTSISATELSVSGPTSLGSLTTSGTASFATTTVTGDLTVTGAVNFSGTPLTALDVNFVNATTSNLVATNSTTTNAVITSLVAGNATTTNATSTNLFAVLSNFTTSIIGTLTAAIATITSLTATNLVATNATSTNAYISNLSAVTASTTNLTATNATFGTTTMTNLAVTNTSTSTFSGNLSVGGTLNFNGTFLQNNLPFTISQWTTSGNNIYYTSGNVGIGTTTPWGKLSVTGAGTGTGQAFVVADSANTPWFSVLDNGNVGIGTTSPGGSLHVRSDSGTIVISERNQTTVNPPRFVLKKSNGSGASPTASSLNDMIGSIDFLGYQPTVGYNSTGNGADARIDAVVDGTPSATDMPVALRFMTKPAASATNSERLRITSAGNVGIGTTSPSGLLEVGNSTNSSILSVVTNANSGNNAHAILQVRNGYAASTDGLRMLVMGTGWTTAGAYLQDAGVIDAGANLSGGLNIMSRNTSAPVRVFTAGSADSNERMRITSAGNVGIGTTTPWRTLSVTGTIGFDGLTGAVGDGSLCLTANKEVVYNSGSDNCLSSLRSTKHDISTLTLDALSQVAALAPVSFIYNNDASSTLRYGFIAEDAAAVNAHLGTYDASGNLSGVDDRGLLAIVVGAIQQIGKTIGDLADRFTTKELTFVRATGDELSVKKLCVEDVCVTRDQFLQIVEQSGQSPAQASSPPAAEPEPEDQPADDTPLSPPDEPAPEEADETSSLPETSDAPPIIPNDAPEEAPAEEPTPAADPPPADATRAANTTANQAMTVLP